jgi:hypothetical protein
MERASKGRHALTYGGPYSCNRTRLKQLMRFTGEKADYSLYEWPSNTITVRLTMREITFEDPIGSKLINPSMAVLRHLILTPDPQYWKQGSGDAILRFKEGKADRRMLIMPNEMYGIYLKFLDEAGEEWLSLGEPGRLKEVTECSDEWFASIGLFVSRERAWLAVEELAQIGVRTDKIAWILPSDLPEDANW